MRGDLSCWCTGAGLIPFGFPSALSSATTTRVEDEMLEDASARLIAVTSRFMLGALLSVGIVAAANAQTVVMKLSTATLNDAQHEWMKRFAAKIATKSGGRIKAEVYPA